jgi:hypothetical protein
MDEPKAEGQLPQGCQLRPVKYLNNRKGQVQAGGVQAQVEFVNSLFGLAA